MLVGCTSQSPLWFLLCIFYGVFSCSFSHMWGLTPNHESPATVECIFGWCRGRRVSSVKREAEIWIKLHSLPPLFANIKLTNSVVALQQQNPPKKVKLRKHKGKDAWDELTDKLKIDEKDCLCSSEYTVVQNTLPQTSAKRPQLDVKPRKSLHSLQVVKGWRKQTELPQYSTS